MAFNSSTISVGSTTKKSHFDQLLDNTISLKSENITINGEKTFASATIFSASATFNSTVRASSIISRTSTAGIGVGTGWLGQSSTASVVVMRCKIIEIGGWNMDTDLVKEVAHEMPDHTKIRVVNVAIRTDTGPGQTITGFIVPDFDLGGTHIDKISWNAINIRLDRITGGFFDGAEYDDDSINRGYVTIWYVE